VLKEENDPLLTDEFLDELVKQINEQNGFPTDKENEEINKVME
jgi:hypothetical protein